jgi:hypothetical protein
MKTYSEKMMLFCKYGCCTYVRHTRQGKKRKSLSADVTIRSFKKSARRANKIKFYVEE